MTGQGTDPTGHAAAILREHRLDPEQRLLWRGHVAYPCTCWNGVGGATWQDGGGPGPYDGAALEYAATRLRALFRALALTTRRRPDD